MYDVLILVTFVLSIFFTWALTAKVRAYALKKNLLDVPNERSSHIMPTPRGGGLAVVAVILLTSCLAVLVPGAETRLIVPVLFIVTAFAILGWQDDRHNLSALARFIIQVIIATLCSVYMAWANIVNVPLYQLAGYMILLFMVLWITWLTNLYNFMDGIDGITGVESLVLGATVSYWFASHGSLELAIIAVSVVGSALGFLWWNWAPAKIFMGDVGSLSLGGFFAVMAIIGIEYTGLPATAFLVLYSVYLVDATSTLLVRVYKRERWWSAHRSHYYQRAVQSGLSHAQVSLAVLMMNIVLSALASLVIANRLPGYIAVTITVIILATIMFLINLRSKRMQSN